MKAIKNIVKNNALVGLGAAVAVGTMLGMKKVADKHKAELSKTKTHQKMTEMLGKAVETGTGVVSTVKDDINTVIDTVKTEATAVAKKVGSDDTDEPTVTTEDEETADLPEPVKAEDVVARTNEADAALEALKNEKLAAKPADDHAEGIAPVASETVKKANAKPAKAKTTARKPPVQKDKD